jgi:SWI/SNF-related matrix-associated actin-dependent regulator of chromatin subfamily A member 5
MDLTCRRFWYKRLITRLDTGALNEVFNPNGQNEIKDEGDTSFDSFEIKTSNVSIKKENKFPAITGENKIDTDNGNAWKKLMNLLIQLRKVCNQSPPQLFHANHSPYMFPNSEPEPYVSGEHIVLASGKYILLDKLLPKLFSEGHRVLLFSGFTSYLPPPAKKI